MAHQGDLLKALKADLAGKSGKKPDSLVRFEEKRRGRGKGKKRMKGY